MSKSKVLQQILWRGQQTEETVYGQPAAGLIYERSNVFLSRDWSRHCRAETMADSGGHTRGSCLWVEAYLSAFYEQPVIIEHVIAGVNGRNGFPYHIFGYRFEDGE